MARIRTIKPEFCSSADAGALSREARLFFLVLLTEVDDAGRVLWIPRRLCGVLYPHDEDVTPDLLTRWLRECESRNMITRYVVAGVEYLQITNWAKHQRISHPTESRLPAHDSEGARIVSESLRNISGEAPETLHPDLGFDLGKDQGGESPVGDSARERPTCLANVKGERLRQVTADAVTAFNDTLGKPNGLLPKVHIVNKVREANVNRCLSVARDICRDFDGPDAQITPKFWEGYFRTVDRDPFKSGRQRGGAGHENWVPDFEYLTRMEVMMSVFDKAMSENAT